MIREFNGIGFDNFTKRHDEELNDWSQVCQTCVDKNKINEIYLDNAGSGICGIEGCDNESNYYIDFPNDRENYY